MSNTGNGDGVARDSEGRPLYDRFGRPIRRRTPNANAQGAGTPAGSAGVPGGAAGSRVVPGGVGGSRVVPGGVGGSRVVPGGAGNAPGGNRPQPAVTRLTPEQLAAVRSGQPLSAVLGNAQAGGAQQANAAGQQPNETQFLPQNPSARAASPYGQQAQAPYGQPLSPYGQQAQDPYPAGAGAGAAYPAGDPSQPAAVPTQDALHRARPVNYQPGAEPQRQGAGYGSAAGVQAGAQQAGQYAPQYPPQHASQGGGSGHSAPGSAGQGGASGQPSRRKFTVPRILRFLFRRGRWLRTLGILLLVFILVLGGTAFWVDGKLPRIDALTNYDGRPSAGSGTNWLLVGSDSREGLTEEQQAELSTGGDTGGGRTDSIMIVHIPAFGKATVLSLPRDSYVNIPGYGKNKINAAFAFGGPQLLQQTVEQATGLHMDHYAEIGFGGFASIVDAVGGVNICVEQVMDDPLAGINLQPGCQTLNGANALGFVRSRHSMADGDIGRARNQRTFLAALTKKILSPSSLLNPFKFFPLVSNISASFTVNKGDHVWDLARLAWALARSPKTESAPVGGYADTDVGSVVLWDDAAAQELFASLR